MKKSLLLIPVLLMILAGIVYGEYARPRGETRFRDLSQASQPLPSAELDGEFNGLATYFNGLQTLTQNISEWAESQNSPVYVSTNSFTLTTDLTGTMAAGRAIRVTVTGGYVYSIVASSSYNSLTGKTTVVLVDSALNNSMSIVYYGILAPDAKSMPVSAAVDAKIWNTVEANVGSAIGAINANVFTNLSTAKADPSTAGKTIIVSTVLSANNLTLPANRGLRIEQGGRIDVTSGKTLTINGPFSAGIYQVFAGTGTVTFGSGAVDKVYPQWWATNTTPGTTDMTAALLSAINSGCTNVQIVGTLAVGNLTMNLDHGVIFQGIGAGRWRGDTYKSRLLFNGSSGESIINIQNSANVQFRDIMLDGATNTGGGIWVQNDPAGGGGENNFIRFEQVVFYKCTSGLKIGGNGYTAANYNQIFSEGVSFTSCTTPVVVSNNQLEFFTFRNCFFIDSNDYHIYASTGVPIALEHVYFQNLDTTNGVAAVYGPVTPQWSDVWSELGDFPVLIATQRPDHQESLIQNSYFTNQGTAASGSSVQWNGGGALHIQSSHVAGKIIFDSRLRDSTVVFDSSVFAPTPTSTDPAITAGANVGPVVSGTYSGTAGSVYTVEIVTGGALGTATFKWKVGAGAFSSAIITAKQSAVEKGLLLNWAVGVTYVTGDQWTFTAHPCGLYDLSGRFIQQPPRSELNLLSNTQIDEYKTSIGNNTWTTVATLTANSALGYIAGVAEITAAGYLDGVGAAAGFYSFRYSRNPSTANFTIAAITNSCDAHLTAQAVAIGDGLTLAIQLKNDAGTGIPYVRIKNSYGADSNIYGMSITRP